MFADFFAKTFYQQFLSFFWSILITNWRNFSGKMEGWNRHHAPPHIQISTEFRNLGEMKIWKFESNYWNLELQQPKIWAVGLGHVHLAEADVGLLLRRKGPLLGALTAFLPRGKSNDTFWRCSQKSWYATRVKLKTAANIGNLHAGLV